MDRVPLNPPVYRNGKCDKNNTGNHNPHTKGFKVVLCLYCGKEFTVANHMTAMGEYWLHMAKCCKQGITSVSRQ